MVWKVCRSFARNEEDRKDLFQEILYNLWKGRNSFSGDSKVGTWIYRVSLNRAIDYSRKKHKNTVEFKDLHSPKDVNSKGDYDLEALDLAIKKLEPLNRAIIILYLEHYSYREIGGIMGISEKNVSVKLVRIKERLKEYYLQFKKVRKS